MAVDQRQAAILAAHIKGKNLVCPLCGTKSWHVVEIISHPVRGANVLTHPNFEKTFLNEPQREAVFFGTESGPKFTSTISFSVGETTSMARSYLPVAIVACTNCHYLIQLAWLPIVREARERGRR